MLNFELAQHRFGAGYVVATCAVAYVAALVYGHSSLEGVVRVLGMASGLSLAVTAVSMIPMLRTGGFRLPAARVTAAPAAKGPAAPSRRLNGLVAIGAWRFRQSLAPLHQPEPVGVGQQHLPIAHLTTKPAVAAHRAKGEIAVGLERHGTTKAASVIGCHPADP